MIPLPVSTRQHGKLFQELFTPRTAAGSRIEAEKEAISVNADAAMYRARPDSLGERAGWLEGEREGERERERERVTERVTERERGTKATKCNGTVQELSGRLTGG